MFDWDRDYGAVVAPRAAAAPARQGGFQPLLAGLLAAALWLWPSASHDARFDPALAVFGQPLAGLMAPAALPPGLIAYGPGEAERFRTGLGRFADRDLLAYADETRRMLLDLDGPVAPFLADALLLAEAEAARRGLALAPVPEALRQFRDAARG